MNNFFNDIVYINRDARTDRRDISESHFAELGLTVRRVSAIDAIAKRIDPLIKETNANGLRDTYDALSKTLIGIFEQAIADDLDNILILEDDCEFTPGAVGVFNKCVKVRTRTIEVDDLEKPIFEFDIMAGTQTDKVVGYEKKEVEQEYRYLPPQWSVLYLGCYTGGYATPVIAGRVHRLYSASMGHAFGFARHAFAPIIERLSRLDCASDVCISDMFFSDKDTFLACAILPSIAGQRADYSDCMGKDVPAKGCD